MHAPMHSLRVSVAVLVLGGGKVTGKGTGQAGGLWNQGPFANLVTPGFRSDDAHVGFSVHDTCG